MLTLSDLQIGVCFLLNGAPHQILSREHSKLGRGGAILHCKIKNLKTGATSDHTFKGNDSVEEVEVSRSRAQFLYADQQDLYLMDRQTFEQFTLPKEIAGPLAQFLTEEIEVEVLKSADQPINISLPVKIDLKVTYTEPAVRGDTAQGKITKPAQLEGGAQIQVPIFIKVGDKVRVNTQTGQYVGRC